MAESAETLLRKRWRQEWWAAGSGFASQFVIKSINKYLLDDYVPDSLLTSWLILIFGGAIAPCFIWFGHIQRKLRAYLGQSYKDNLLGEMRALQALNNPAAWALYRRKTRWSSAIQFCFFSSLGGFLTTFFF